MSESPKRQAPAFQFYADDFIAGTVDMSPAEVGAYIRLLCYQWSRGSAPALPEKMQRVAGGIVSEDVIAKFPLCEDGNRRNKRLEDVRKASDAFRKIQAEKAHSRWKKDAAALPGHNPGSAGGDAGAIPKPMPNGVPNACSPSPSPSPINTPKAPKGAEPVGFDEFWKAYPKKVAKPAAIKAWAKLNPNDETFRKILESVKTQSASPDWLKDGGQFIPYPATYLNGRRWEDVFELPETKETLEAKLLAHRGCPSHVNRSNATPEDLAEYAEMLKRYKALP